MYICTSKSRAALFGTVTWQMEKVRVVLQNGKNLEIICSFITENQPALIPRAASCKQLSRHLYQRFTLNFWVPTTVPPLFFSPFNSRLSIGHANLRANRAEESRQESASKGRGERNRARCRASWWSEGRNSRAVMSVAGPASPVMPRLEAGLPRMAMMISSVVGV